MISGQKRCVIPTLELDNLRFRRNKYINCCCLNHKRKHKIIMISRLWLSSQQTVIYTKWTPNIFFFQVVFSLSHLNQQKDFISTCLSWSILLMGFSVGCWCHLLTVWLASHAPYAIIYIFSYHFYWYHPLWLPKYSLWTFLYY